MLLLFNSIDVPFKGTQHWRGPFMNWLLILDLGYEPLNRFLKALVDLFLSTSEFRNECFAEFFTPFTTTILYLIGVEAAHAHKQFIGEQQVGHLIHFLDGADDFHQKNKEYLGKRDIFSSLIFRIKAF